MAKAGAAPAGSGAGLEERLLLFPQPERGRRGPELRGVGGASRGPSMAPSWGSSRACRRTTWLTANVRTPLHP